jgi:transcriptional regulator with XRE-family HTH domain
LSTPLGNELRRLRKEKGLTLETTANEIGVTLQYLSLLEKGNRKAVSFEIMTNISRYYGVPLDYFTTFIDENTQEGKKLSEHELKIWNEINQQVQVEVYYKNSNVLRDWLRSIFKTSK